MPTKQYSIEESPDKFLTLGINIPKNQGSYNSSDFRVEKTPARKAIESIFYPNSFYTLLRTSANPAAIEEVPKNNTRLAKVRCFKPGEYDFHFDASIMDTYLDALKLNMEKSIGRNYASFPLVATRDVHNLDRPLESVQWPTVHVIGGSDKTFLAEHKNIFRDCVESMSGNDETYDIIKMQEYPQYYNMGVVDLLREKRIPPLVIHKREWDVSSEELRNAIDFLSSFTYVEKHNDGRFDDFPNADDL